MTMRAQMGDAPRILDLSRTVARGAERAPTGIDRVERAYLGELLNQRSPAFGLVRTRVGFLLLDRSGLSRLSRALENPSELASVDLVSRLSHRKDPARSKLETMVRTLAHSRASRWGLAGMLRHNLPSGTEYCNVGHSNLTDRVFQALSSVPHLTATVVLNDLLPLTHPQFNRSPAVIRAERMVRVISKHADRVVHISEYSRISNESLLGRCGRVPPGLVAALGAREPLAVGTHEPTILPPYFLAIGTIEPRKNLGFLLDLWDAMAGDPAFELPVLVLAGARGWESAAFFDRLSRHPLYGSKIKWIESPDDSQVDALLLGSHGLVFPSHAEGQGLPPLEAASAGVPVICQPLPPLIEFLEGYAQFANCDDLASWHEKIKGLLAGQTPQRLTVPDTLPTWEQHFAAVFDGEGSSTAQGRTDKGIAVCV